MSVAGCDGEIAAKKLHRPPIDSTKSGRIKLHHQFAMSFSAAAYSDPRRSLTHADVNRLAPHMNILGLTSLPPDEQTVQRAYKQALRQNPGRVDALRLAANVMATEESRREFLRTAPMMPAPAPTLSLGVRKANHQITASCKVATQGSGCPPCAVASSRGCRPTMEDAHIAGEPVGHMGHVFAVLDGHGGMRAANCCRTRYRVRSPSTAPTRAA